METDIQSDNLIHTNIVQFCCWREVPVTEAVLHCWMMKQKMKLVIVLNCLFSLNSSFLCYRNNLFCCVHVQVLNSVFIVVVT